jgi:hypothetical protein
MTFLADKFILGAFVALIIIWGIIRHYRRQQRYIPGVPIVGGKSNIKKNRKLFATQSLQILRKGYEEVSKQARLPGTIFLLSGVDRTMASYSMFPLLSENA